MPIVTFTERELKRGKPLPPAWYTLTIENVGESLSADKQSTNYPVEATVVRNADTGDTEWAGTPIEWNFNSKFMRAAADFLLCFGIEVAAGKRFELGATAGKQVDVYVENK